MRLYAARVTLEQNAWWEDDPEFGEHLVYFLIKENDEEVWSSSWYDIREFCEDKDTIIRLRDEVEQACEEWGVSRDLSSDDYSDWKDKA